jgi:hypothetical protein
MDATAAGKHMKGTDMQSYEILESAAAQIERHGWVQNVLVGWDGSMCAMGAMFMVSEYHDDLLPAMRALCAVLNRPCDALTDSNAYQFAQFEIVNWNDEHGREKLDVVIALRKAAANERARDVSDGITDLCATFSKAATQVTALVSAIETFEPMAVRKRPARTAFTVTAFGADAWVKPGTPLLETQ